MSREPAVLEIHEEVTVFWFTGQKSIVDVPVIKHTGDVTPHISTSMIIFLLLREDRRLTNAIKQANVLLALGDAYLCWHVWCLKKYTRRNYCT